MEEWKQFELACVDYLNHAFGNYAKFVWQGGEDSTVADIKVVAKTGKVFYMEAKKCPAQCGQFVLLPNDQTRTFDYSSRNTCPINQYSEAIIDYMNTEFEAFREAGTSGKDIIIEDSQAIFAAWIINAYRNKGVRYFITNDYRIFPIDQLSNNFLISAKYRIKRSGSIGVGRAMAKELLEHIENNFQVLDARVDGDKLYIKSDVELHDTRFHYGDYEYMFSKRASEYEIRKLSNTFNANVIFSVFLKDNVSDQTDFIKSLK